MTVELQVHRCHRHDGNHRHLRHHHREHCDATVHRLECRRVRLANLQLRNLTDGFTTKFTCQEQRIGLQTHRNIDQRHDEERRRKHPRSRVLVPSEQLFARPLRRLHQNRPQHRAECRGKENAAHRGRALIGNCKVRRRVPRQQVRCLTRSVDEQADDEDRQQLCLCTHAGRQTTDDCHCVAGLQSTPAGATAHEPCQHLRHERSPRGHRRGGNAAPRRRLTEDCLHHVRTDRHRRRQSRRCRQLPRHQHAQRAPLHLGNVLRVGHPLSVAGDDRANTPDLIWVVWK